jgi:hypothetical protein
VNLARLLQTVDTDFEPTNGISISDAVHAAATSPADFADDAGFDDAVGNVVSVARGGVTALVTAEDAVAHLASSFPIVGAWSWSFGSPDPSHDVLVLTFLADGSYVMAGGYGNQDLENGQPGIEMGKYTWNPATHEWTATAGQPDTDGEWSFSHPIEGGIRGTARATVTVDGSTLLMVDPTGVDSMAWTRVAEPEPSLVGSWFAWSPDEPTRPVFVTFLPGGRYLHAEGLPADLAGHPGIELGSYEWDPASGVLTVDAESISYDTNGEWGFSHPNPGGSGSYQPVAVRADVRNGNELTMDPDFDPTTTADQMTWRRIGVEGAAAVPE